MKRRRTNVAWLALFAALCSGCFSHEEDVAAKSQGVLLPVEVLARWVDNGHEDDAGRRVVILDTGYDMSLDTRPDYDAGHIPGAHFVSAVAFYQDRSKGHVIVPAMVPDGATMDALVQGFGVDGETAVVFAGNHIWGNARAYWTFRYWGFPRENLFLLNGKKKVWTDSGRQLETAEPPAPTPSTFSVKEWPAAMDQVTVSTPELMMAAEGSSSDAVIVDARHELEWYGQQVPPATAPFGFRVKNSVWKRWATLLEGEDAGDHVFRPVGELVDEYEALGLTREKTAYTFCQAGGRAAVHFVVLDGVLMQPVKVHDGSSFELGQLASIDNASGEAIGLPEDSPWRFDLERYSSLVVYNAPALTQPSKIVDAYTESSELSVQLDKAYLTGAGCGL